MSNRSPTPDSSSPPISISPLPEEDSEGHPPLQGVHKHVLLQTSRMRAEMQGATIVPKKRVSKDKRKSRKKQRISTPKGMVGGEGKGPADPGLLSKARAEARKDVPERWKKYQPRVTPLPTLEIFSLHQLKRKKKQKSRVFSQKHPKGCVERIAPDQEGHFWPVASFTINKTAAGFSPWKTPNGKESKVVLATVKTPHKAGRPYYQIQAHPRYLMENPQSRSVGKTVILEKSETSDYRITKALKFHPRNKYINYTTEARTLCNFLKDMEPKAKTSFLRAARKRPEWLKICITSKERMTFQKMQEAFGAGEDLVRFLRSKNYTPSRNNFRILRGISEWPRGKRTRAIEKYVMGLFITRLKPSIRQHMRDINYALKILGQQTLQTQIHNQSIWRSFFIKTKKIKTPEFFTCTDLRKLLKTAKRYIEKGNFAKTCYHAFVMTFWAVPTISEAGDIKFEDISLHNTPEGTVLCIRFRTHSRPYQRILLEEVGDKLFCPIYAAKCSFTLRKRGQETIFADKKGQALDKNHIEKSWELILETVCQKYPNMRQKYLNYYQKRRALVNFYRIKSVYWAYKWTH